MLSHFWGLPVGMNCSNLNPTHCRFRFLPLLVTNLAVLSLTPLISEVGLVGEVLGSGCPCLLHGFTHLSPSHLHLWFRLHKWLFSC